MLAILERAWQDDFGFAATCAVLCKSVLERVRRILYTCPILTSVAQINLFLRTIKKSNDLANRVRAAVLNGACAGINRLGTGERMRGAVTTRLPQLLESCTNLQELTLKDAIVFSLTDFSHADCESKEMKARSGSPVLTISLCPHSAVAFDARRNALVGSHDDAEVPKVLHSAPKPLDSHAPFFRV